MIRVLIVEDHPLIIAAVRYELSLDPEFEVVGELKNSFGLAKLVRDKQVDVLILDLSLTGETFEPVTAVRSLTSGNPNLGILILTGMDNPLMMSALTEAGALGYILKSDDLSLLVRAVRRFIIGTIFIPSKSKLNFSKWIKQINSPKWSG